MLNISETTAKHYDDILVKEGVLVEVINPTENDWYSYIDSDAKNCVYRYLDKHDNILYVGKTNILYNRNYQHSICEEDKIWFEKSTKLEYIEFNTYDDCGMAEAYFISKYKPFYNTRHKKTNYSLSISELDNAIWKHIDMQNRKRKNNVTYEKGENYDKIKKMIEEEITDGLISGIENEDLPDDVINVLKYALNKKLKRRYL